MGSNSTKSDSKPLTAEERTEAYNAGMSNINPQYAEYEAPDQQGYERLTMDYDALQGDLTKGYTAGLDYAKNKDTEGVNNDLAKRGVWSSGLSQRALENVNATYAPQYARAGADATNARYGLQMQDLSMYNQGVANQNATKMQVADKQYESKWRPADYAAGIWNGTGGVVSSSNSSGWSI